MRLLRFSMTGFGPPDARSGARSTKPTSDATTSTPAIPPNNARFVRSARHDEPLRRGRQREQRRAGALEEGRLVLAARQARAARRRSRCTAAGSARISPFGMTRLRFSIHTGTSSTSGRALAR